MATSREEVVVPRPRRHGKGAVASIETRNEAERDVAEDPGSASFMSNSTSAPQSSISPILPDHAMTAETLKMTHSTSSAIQSQPEASQTPSDKRHLQRHIDQNDQKSRGWVLAAKFVIWTICSSIRTFLRKCAISSFWILIGPMTSRGVRDRHDGDLCTARTRDLDLVAEGSFCQSGLLNSTFLLPLVDIEDHYQGAEGRRLKG